MNENPRHAISRALDEHCDQLHPEQARRIIAALDAAGYVIARKEPDIRMMQAGVIAWRRKHDSQVYAEPLAEACYKAMIGTGNVDAFDARPSLIGEVK